MLPRVAPIALRTPISRVRSVTETSMMFMIPMPPTSRLTSAIPARRTEKVRVVSWKVDMRSARLRTKKSLSSPGCSRCSRRMMRSISTIAWSTSSGRATSTVNEARRSLPLMR